MKEVREFKCLGKVLSKHGHMDINEMVVKSTSKSYEGEECVRGGEGRPKE